MISKPVTMYSPSNKQARKKTQLVARLGLRTQTVNPRQKRIIPPVKGIRKTWKKS
jgi:hypothetical protein